MRFHFSLILVVVAGSIVIGDDNLDESTAIAKIELLGGRITRDDSLPGSPVVGIDFQGSVRVNDLKQLKLLDLQFTEITDIGLKELNELPNLTMLWLSRTAITDEGLREIGRLRQLTALHLANTNITDDGLKHLVDLKNLTRLRLDGTEVTDAGLKEFQSSLPTLTINDGRRKLDQRKK